MSSFYLDVPDISSLLKTGMPKSWNYILFPQEITQIFFKNFHIFWLFPGYISNMFEIYLMETNHENFWEMSWLFLKKENILIGKEIFKIFFFYICISDKFQGFIHAQWTAYRGFHSLSRLEVVLIVSIL